MRSKLRAALRAQSAGEYERSSTFFQAAYSLAQDLFATGELGASREEAVLRLTGIAVRWGAMWESTAEYARAIDAYDTGFQPVAAVVEGHKLEGQAEPSRAEVMRGAGIAMKLGDLWVRVGGPEANSEAERYYTWSVQELMRLSLTGEQKDKVRAEMAAQEAPVAAGTAAEKATKVDADEETKLPNWVSEVELVAVMERLGELYSRMGKIECVSSSHYLSRTDSCSPASDRLATPLLQQAIAMLFPPPPKQGPKPPMPPIPQRCHASTLVRPN